MATQQTQTAPFKSLFGYTTQQLQIPAAGPPTLIHENFLHHYRRIASINTRMVQW